MNVRDNLAGGKYKNDVPYAIKATPVDEDLMTVRQAREHVDAEKKRAADQKLLHREEGNRLTELLRRDLEEEHGVSGHAKASKLWSMAWSHGHSAGYEEVIGYYEDFAELLK